MSGFISQPANNGDESTKTQPFKEHKNFEIIQVDYVHADHYLSEFNSVQNNQVHNFLKYLLDQYMPLGILKIECIGIIKE